MHLLGEVLAKLPCPRNKNGPRFREPFCMVVMGGLEPSTPGL